MQHIFVGLYLQQICLAALFFLAQDQNSHASAVPEGALMVVLIVFTAFFHIIINNSYGPLIKFLPLTLADMTHGKDDENVAAAAKELQDEASDAGHSTAEDEKRSSLRKRSSVASGSAKEFPTKAEADTEAAAEGGLLEAGEASSPVEDARSRKGSRLSQMPGVDEEAGPKDFYHPASVEPQPVVWLPRDPLGLGEAEERACREAGIEVSTRDAVMDDKGHVDIQGPPPDVEQE